MMKFSIRYKILAVVTTLLLGALACYLALASHVFRQDKSELVFDLNKSIVTTVASELEATLQSASDQLRLFAILTAQNPSQDTRAPFAQILDHDETLVYLSAYDLTQATPTLVTSLGQSHFEKVYGLNDNYFLQEMARQKPIPFAAIQADGLAVWNSTLSNGPPLLGIGISVVKEGSHGEPVGWMAMIGYLQAAGITKQLRTSSLAHIAIVGANGQVLLGGDASTEALQAKPLRESLGRQSVSSGVVRYNVGPHDWLSAYARIKTGSLAVVSQVDGIEAFRAVRSLITRSLIFALIIATTTFIATIFFSRTLTQPLQKLLSAIERVSQGHLTEEVEVKTNDEIEKLAQSFNQMTKDLRLSRSELEDANKDLEKKVRDRTRAIQEAQEALIRTTRLASVGEIAGRAAHEVLNPLTSLMTRLQKVQRRLKDEASPTEELFQQIVASWQQDFSEKGASGLWQSLEQPSQLKLGETLLEEDLENLHKASGLWKSELGLLLDDLDFSYQQASRIERILNHMRSLSAVSSQKTVLAVDHIIKDTINIVGDMFMKNNVSIRFESLATNCQVRLDRDEFIQVLTNILRNSMHAVIENKEALAVRQETPLVIIRTQNKDNKLLVRVVDNGIGIADEHRTKLFESQFSTKSIEQGTGLGLSISRRLVRGFDGDLFMESTALNKGSVFCVELPLNMASASREVAA